MAAAYAYSYEPVSVYAQVVALIARHSAREGVHLDIGCGHGAIAEPLRDFGLVYVGLDADPAGPAALHARAFESGHIDLQALDTIEATLIGALAGRPLASISMLDTLEHITNGPQVLALLRRFATTYGPVPLVLSVPNATHVDIGIKLLTGRWDWTDAGLLDHTHVAFYGASHLDAVMANAGWSEVGRDDYRLTFSDQHFPADSIVLSHGTNLGALLHDVRAHASNDDNVNQFVRAYLPGSMRNVAVLADRQGSPQLFMTVVMRTQGRRIATLRDALLCLDAQTCDDFDVVLVIHKATHAEYAAVQRAVADQSPRLRQRIRIVQESDGGRARPLNTGVEHIRGRYVAMLDDDDLVLAHWIETFLNLATAFPGRQLRTVAVEQDIHAETWPDGTPGLRMESGYRTVYPERFDMLAHTARNYSPLMTWAFPRQLFDEMGLRFDESLPVCEDWDMVLRGASICGVADAAEVTAIYRRWTGGEASNVVHSPEEWLDAATTIAARLDRHPIVLQPGYFARIRHAMHLIDAAREAEVHFAARVEAARAALDAQTIQAEADQHALRLLVAEQAARIRALETSTSWRVTRPLRMASDRLRRS